jgi:hypothetical protein
MQKSPEVTPTPKRPQVLAVRYAHRPFGKRKRIMASVIASLIGLSILFFGWQYWAKSPATYIDSSKYQAVFLDNNQVYFGKLHQLHDNSVRLTDVYYLQQQATMAETDKSGKVNQQANSTQTPQLVKLGSELHGPEDSIVFSGSQVLFWENLKSDSKVTKAIQDYLKK